MKTKLSWDHFWCALKQTVKNNRSKEYTKLIRKVKIT